MLNLGLELRAVSALLVSFSLNPLCFRTVYCTLDTVRLSESACIAWATFRLITPHLSPDDAVTHVMPATDAADQQAARALETRLRDAVVLRERPPVELEWFKALPKRIRRSARLRESAQLEAKTLLDFARDSWARYCRAEREREERLERAKSTPRDLECLRSPDPVAWSGLGRRKKRCRAFNTVGRAFTARHRSTAPAAATLPVPVPQSTVVDIFSLHLAPTRPSTPPGVREALYNTADLVYVANGPADGAEYGPPSPIYSPSPEPSPLPPAPAYPESLQPGAMRVFNREVDPHFAWIVARGRHAWAPYSDCSLREAAFNVASAEENVPGLLAQLTQLLFPGGVRRDDLAVDPVGLEVVLDFVHGWFVILSECA